MDGEANRVKLYGQLRSQGTTRNRGDRPHRRRGPGKLAEGERRAAGLRGQTPRAGGHVRGLLH